jgi:hypothetical protein
MAAFGRSAGLRSLIGFAEPTRVYSPLSQGICLIEHQSAGAALRSFSFGCETGRLGHLAFQRLSQFSDTFAAENIALSFPPKSGFVTISSRHSSLLCGRWLHFGARRGVPAGTQAVLKRLALPVRMNDPLYGERRLRLQQCQGEGECRYAGQIKPEEHAAGECERGDGIEKHCDRNEPGPP